MHSLKEFSVFVPVNMVSGKVKMSYRDIHNKLDEEIIAYVIRLTNGNISRGAKMLGLSRMTFAEKCSFAGYSSTQIRSKHLKDSLNVR